MTTQQTLEEQLKIATEYVGKTVAAIVDFHSVCDSPSDFIALGILSRTLTEHIKRLRLIQEQIADEQRGVVR